MPSPKILVVDDEPQIRKFLRIGLVAQDYAVVEAANAASAALLAASERPDLVILDLGLPDRDGTAVIGEIRDWSRMPIIVLSIRTEESDKVAALDLGADDYITKPFLIGELLDRVRIALAHGAQLESGPAPSFVAGRLVLDLAGGTGTLDGVAVDLTPVELALLRLMVRHAGLVLTHAQLLRDVFGPGHDGQLQSLRVLIGRLRLKLEADPARPALLVTEPGVGYRLRQPA